MIKLANQLFAFASSVPSTLVCHNNATTARSLPASASYQSARVEPGCLLRAGNFSIRTPETETIGVLYSSSLAFPRRHLELQLHQERLAVRALDLEDAPSVDYLALAALITASVAATLAAAALFLATRTSVHSPSVASTDPSPIDQGRSVEVQDLYILSDLSPIKGF